MPAIRHLSAESLVAETYAALRITEDMRTNLVLLSCERLFKPHWVTRKNVLVRRSVSWLTVRKFGTNVGDAPAAKSRHESLIDVANVTWEA